VARRRVSSPVRSLIAGYLDRFVEDDIDIARLGAGIRMLIEDTSWCGCHAWLERSRAFGLFEAAEAPNGIARRILLSEQPPDETLRQAGLDTPARLNGGLSQAAFKNACAQCAMLRGPAAEAVQRRLIDWAKGTDGRLIFESLGVGRAVIGLQGRVDLPNPGLGRRRPAAAGRQALARREAPGSGGLRGHDAMADAGDGPSVP
jgi:hypothetical protein